jgi:long-chain acyl-CoA synthetase
MLGQKAVTSCANTEGRVALVVFLRGHLAPGNAKLDPHEKLDCLSAVTAA